MPKTIRLHAGGAVETFEYTDDPTYYPPATIVGVAPQWDDGSDATYARSQTDASSSDFRSLMARLDVLPASITLAQVVSISVHLRYDTAHPSGETSRAFTIAIWDDTHRTTADTYVYRVSSTGADFPATPDDDLIHEVDYNIYPLGATFVDVAALVTSLQGGAWLNPSTLLRNPWKRSALTVYEAWIDVTVNADTAVRQYPRDDTHGHGATTRTYPPPRTNRTVGGQP